MWFWGVVELIYILYKGKFRIVTFFFILLLIFEPEGIFIF